MSNYARANTTAQWFEDNFPGAVTNPNVVVIHTTESTGWPSYQGGATAPNYTAHPDMKAKRLEFRAHYPDERSARALQNHAGGVETNTLNCVQLELIGTCDPSHARRWAGLKAGVDYIYWPEAPDWALEDVGAFLADQHERHGTKLEAPSFEAYPASFGTGNGVRMSDRQWRNFYGVCGHQHVPENVHGDPGDIPIQTILAHAKGDPKKETRKPVVVDNHVTKGKAQILAGCNMISDGIRELWKVSKRRRFVWLMCNTVQANNKLIRAALKAGPES